MYVTAQRIGSRGRTGINGFLFLHAPDQSSAAINWDRPDLPSIARNNPGLRAGEVVSLPPGGSDVLTYLDIAAADATPVAAIEEELEAVRQEAVATHSAVQRFGGPVAVWFNFTRATLMHGTPEDELAALSEVVLTLVRKRPRVVQTDPLVLVRQTTLDGFTFALDPNSLTRVHEYILKHDIELVPAAISISREVLDSFEQAMGPILSHVAAAATGLGREALLQLGGLRIIDDQTGVVYSWPHASNPQLA